MKKKWNLKTTPYGFALLNELSLWHFATKAFIDPFRRFYFEGYIQTVLVSDLSHLFYKGLVKKITDEEISHNYNYQLLSKYFELAAKLGGVSIKLLFIGHCYFKAVRR